MSMSLSPETIRKLWELTRRDPTWNVPLPGSILPPAPCPPWQPDPVAIEALRLMRDTTQSKTQHDRAVASLKALGVQDE